MITEDQFDRLITALEKIASSMPVLAENVRTDHPLMESDLSEALNNIASAIDNHATEVSTIAKMLDLHSCGKPETNLRVK
jgi:hypothetical protein